MKVAVLLTCFNRKEKTRKCLEILFSQQNPKDVEFDAFVCDDNSSDGTAGMIASNFPQVTVTSGSGKLFWGLGMRAAWVLASKSGEFDYYLWLNDDTFLFPDTLVRLFDEYERINKIAILTAACKKPQTEEFSYGGFNDDGVVLPNGSLQKVKYINGNLVLIPKEIVNKIGFNSPKYTHYLGDYDYGLRAQKAGYDCYTTSTYLAECDVNDFIYWGSASLDFLQRWEQAHAVKGLALNEHITYQIYHNGRWVGAKLWVSCYLKIFWPRFSPYFRTNLKAI